MTAGTPAPMTTTIIGPAEMLRARVNARLAPCGHQIDARWLAIPWWRLVPRWR